MTHLLIFLTCFNLSYGQKFLIYNGDTINVVDASNMKQGHWIYFGNMKKLPGYAADAKVEEGKFANNRKTGMWIKYFPDGKLQNEITFVNNRPNGIYKIYYDNGQLQEKGEWKNNRNVGDFIRYHKNGEKQQDFEFNTSGKRDGKQEYYHENGQVMIEGNWAGGKEDGEIKEYYANGDLKAIKVFNSGVVDVAKTETYEPKEPIAEVIIDPELPIKTAKVEKDAKPNLGFFTGNGHSTLYRKDKQISQKGLFKNGKLIDGKWYRYDKDGILQSIEIYKNGRYVGEGVIDEG